MLCSRLNFPSIFWHLQSSHLLALTEFPSFPLMASSHRENTEQDFEPPHKKRKSSSKYHDVFISHRGPDVKDTLASHLYDSLAKKRICAFLDKHELELGDVFPDVIRDTIKSASVQIAIFSPGYADSTWCLEELALMVESKATIIPIFYGVKHSALRLEKGGVYADAFTRHGKEEKNKDKLERWKSAFKEIPDTIGPKCGETDDLHEVCEPIVRAVETKIYKPLFVADYPVGLDEHVKALHESANSAIMEEGKIKMVGIFGMGGVGKTTLAKAFFNLKRCDYDRSCFLFGVAEKDLPSLQTKLYKDLIDHRDPPKFENPDEGKGNLMYHIRYLQKRDHLRFLIVLDDIDCPYQLEALLVRDAFNSTSLVIVTTRNERLLISAGSTVRYKLEIMDPTRSQKLFCLYAFGQPNPKDEYKEFVDSFVTECEGLPHSLQVLGRTLSGGDRNYWKLQLDEIRKNLHKDVKNIVRRSFESLEKKEKCIFMDTACFFIDKLKSMAMTIWEGCGWNAELAVQTLQDKCLVDVGGTYGEEFDDGKIALRMHSHHRDLGREMAGEMTPPHRLWNAKDLDLLEREGFPKFLAKASEKNLRFLHVLELPITSKITYFFGKSGVSILAPTDLIWLEIDLNGHSCESIHPMIPLENVQSLTIFNGHLKRLWNDVQAQRLQLKELRLHEVKFTSLEECIKSIEKLNSLKKLILKGSYKDNGISTDALRFSNSIGQLTDLTRLALNNLGLEGALAFSTSLSESPMKCLQSIQISGEKHVRKVSISGNRCPCIQSVHLESMENLNNVNLSELATLNFLELRSCRNLKEVSGISDLEKLQTLKICDCPEVEEEIPLARLNQMEDITIDGCQKLQDIRGIERLQTLKRLQLSALGDGVVHNCIDSLQRLPSEITTLITRATGGDSLTKERFSCLTGIETGSEIDINENGMLQTSLKTMQRSMSSIIIYTVVQSNQNEIPVAEWIVASVVTASAKCKRIPNVPSGGKIQNGYIAEVNHGEELSLLKRIVSKLYNT